MKPAFNKVGFFMIRYFNPGHETAVLNGSKFYMAPANVVNMQRDLAYLPAYYSSNDDFILVHESPSSDFTSFTSNELGVCNQCFTKENIISIANRLVGLEVDLWGISPQALYTFETLSKEYSLNLSLPKWDEIYKELSNRYTSYSCLQYLIDNSFDYSKSTLPLFFYNLDDIEKYLEKNDQTRYLVKAPFSSSGRGLLWLPLDGLTRTERQIIHGHLKKQGCVSLERVLDKKIDFAMEFLCKDSQITYQGLSLFQTNSKGAYLSNYIGAQNNIEKKLCEYINKEVLQRTKSLIIDFLTMSVAGIYDGYIGVDMMIYEENGNYKIQPCVEMNVRCNMGILAKSISDRIINENSGGNFFIDFNPRENVIFEEDKLMTQKYPLVIKNKKIESGYFSLCPITEKTKYRAYLLIT